MQDLLTATIVAIAILFTASATADFVAGLIKLWKSAGSQAQPQVSASVLIEQSPAAPKLEAEVIPDPWMLATPDGATLPVEQIVKQQMLLPAAQAQIATLEWTLRNLPPVEIYAAELPCAIAMAKSKLPKAAPVIELATKAQLQSSGIRKLKQLAREIKLSGYGNMRVAQLAGALEGKVAAHQLVA
jgi:hypothetical protein